MARIWMQALLGIIAMPDMRNKEKQLTETAKYWMGRIAALQDGNYAKSDLAIENIERQFRMALAAILDELEKWYNRFADENGLTYAQARKLLTTDELEEFRWTLELYTEYARKHSTDPAWMRKLENASARAHVRRLEQIELQIEAQIQMLTEGIQITIQDLLEEIYKAEYGGMKEILNEGAKMDMDVSYATIDDRAVKQVLDKPWAQDELNFSDRIWNSRAKLIQVIDTAIPQGIIRGQSIDQMADEVAKQTGNTQKNAERLVRTETAAISSEADKQLYKDLGIEEVRFMASLDAITCSVCGDMDLKVIPLRYSQTGVNMPPLHPNCRCYTVPVIEWDNPGGRLSKNKDGSYTEVPADTTYKEWYEKNKDLVDASKKKAKNKYDEELWEKYRTIFGDEAGSTFKEFQDIKYGNPEKWKDLKDRKQEAINAMNAEEVSRLNGKLGNYEVRSWYVKQDQDIINQIDESVSLENQAKQAFDIRNRNRTQARNLMKDQEKRAWLDENYPNQEFEELLKRKEKRYGLTGDDAYRAIIESSRTTNKRANKMVGLET